MTHLDETALEAAREQPGTNHDGIIRAYLSALPSSPVSELVERLQSWDHCWPAPGLENAVAEAATTLTTLSTLNAELEAEIARLRADRDEAMKALEQIAAIEPVSNCDAGSMARSRMRDIARYSIARRPK